MLAPPMSEPPRARLHRLSLFAVATLLAGGCDIQTKSWAVRTLSELPGATMTIVDPWLDLTLAYNRGTAFSFIRDLGDARWLFAVFALVVLGLMIGMVVRSATNRLDVLALAAIGGGALGNGFDRVFRMLPTGGTGVVDFVKVNYPWGGHWPIFNVADALLVIGVAVFLLARWRTRTAIAAGPTPA